MRLGRLCRELTYQSLFRPVGGRKKNGEWDRSVPEGKGHLQTHTEGWERCGESFLE